MNRIKQLYSFILIVSLTALTLAGCDKDDDAPATTETLQDIISKDTSLTIFTAVLNKTHLNTFTTGPGPFTIFAPTNAAYRKEGITSVESLNSIDSNQLVLQTSWLIATGLKSSDFLIGSNLTISTQLGTTIFAQTIGDATYFNGIKAKQRDILASNGIMHTLDTYLAPTYGNTTTTLSKFPSLYKLFYQAILKGGSSTSTAINRQTTTLLAPNDDAMKAAGYDSLTIAGSTSATMAAMVKYHLIGSLYYTYALKSAAYKTDQGSTVSFNMDISPMTVMGKTGTAKFNGFINFTTSNGVIHTIDKVLKP